MGFSKVNVVPTLIAFKGGAEFCRADGVSMVGLRKKDFEQAINVTSGNNLKTKTTK